MKKFIREELPESNPSDNNRLLKEYSETKSPLVLRQLVLNNALFVKSYAKYFAIRYKASYEDLFQEGILGLIKAINRFDISKGSLLTTFSGFYIMESIQKYLEVNYKEVRFPFAKIKLINLLRKKLEERGENISNEELATIFALPIEKIILYRQFIQDAISLDELMVINSVDDNNHELLRNNLKDRRISPEQIALSRYQRRQLLLHLRKVLSKKQLTAVLLRFGFVTSPMIDEEIAKTFNVSRAAIYDRWVNAREVLLNDSDLPELCGIAKGSSDAYQKGKQ